MMRPEDDRRSFFKAVVGRGFSIVEHLRGVPQYRIESLWELDEALFGSIVPRVRDRVGIDMEGSSVWARVPFKRDPVHLFVATHQNTFIFNHFNATFPLSDVAARVAEAFGLGLEEARLAVRELFLDLARKGVCVPAKGVGKPEALFGDDDE